MATIGQDRDTPSPLGTGGNRPDTEARVRYPAPPDLTRFAWLSIGAAIVTILLKSGAAWLTGSVGILSDAAESLVNLVAAVVALVALRVSIRPPDRGHPFGHSKAEYFSAIIEGVMIFVAAAFIVATAIGRILSPRMPDQLGIGLVITTVAALLNGGVGWYLLHQGRAFGSATLVADGKHLLTDVVTSAAVLLGVAAVALTQVPVLDPVVALLAGVNILWTGSRLIKGSVDGLMDRAVPPDTLAAITAVIDRHRVPGEVDVHAIRTRVSGNREFMDCHLLVPDDWSVRRAHAFSEDLIDELVAAVPNLRVSVHIEPIHDPESYADITDF